MAMSQAEKALSHQRIVESAAVLMRENGIAATSVAEAMKAAGLTHGGFYKHFPDKEALAGEALAAAFAQKVISFGERFDSQPPAQARVAHRTGYLSQRHVDNPGTGCPIAALGNDVARGSPELKQQFGRGVRAIIGQVAKGMPGDADQKRAAAAREVAMLAGALILARSVDPETAKMIQSAVLTEQI